MLYELNLRFPDEHHVHVTFEDVDSGALAFVNPLTRKDLQDLQWYLEVYGAHSLGDPDDTEAACIAGRLPELGKLLFESVFTERAASRLFDRFQDQEDGTRLLTITAEQPSILSLPWELLHDSSQGSGFLFLENPRISIRRRVAGVTGGRKPFRVEAKDQLHLLFVVSRPEGASFLDPRADPLAVMDALEAHAPGRVTWEFLRPPTLDALIERLEASGKPPVDVLHFDGHGVFDERGGLPESAKDRTRPARTEELLREAPASAPNTGYLLFETADGQLDFVSAQRLGENLHRHRVSLVVLSACQSAKVGDEGEEDDPDSPMGSVAARLTATGIPAVLAMTHSVLVHTTRQLFGAMYKDLARHRGIGESLDNARRHLREHPERYEIQRGPERVWLRLQDWFLPALYQSGQDVPLLRATPEKAVDPSPPPRTNLRAAPEAGFFGRRRELWEIERGFAGKARRITLTGFGGQGKTALAQEAGRWLLRTGLFEAVVFVDYFRIQAADAVAVAVSNIGSVLEESLIEENAACEALARTSTLVILDNLEVLEPEPLRELLDAAGGWSTAGRSRVLLTTRRPDFDHPEYGVEGTLIHQRIGLAGLGSRRSPDEVLEWFAHLTKLPPAPTIKGSPTRGELIDLFEKVRFHPLSIRVLAEQLKTRRPVELGERLGQLFTGSEAASSGDRDEILPELVASVKLSLDRLDAAARSVLPRLGVFQGGAMEHVLSAITEIPADDWVMLRRQLVAAALVEVESFPGVTMPFLRFHPTLAPLLWAQLSPEDQSRLRKAHRERYRALANFLYQEDRSHPHQARAMVQSEFPNLVHAVHAALAGGDPAAGEFAFCIISFLNALGLRREAASLIALAKKAADVEGSKSWYLAQLDMGEHFWEAGRVKEAVDIFQRVLDKFGAASDLERATILIWLGRCSQASSQAGSAVQYYQEALTTLDRIEMSEWVKRNRGSALTGLADALVSQGCLLEARRAYEDSLDIAHEVGDLRNEGVSHGQLGYLAIVECRFQEAVDRYRDALTLSRQLEEPAMESVALHQLGLAFQGMKEWEKSEYHYREAARIKEEQGMLGGSNGAVSTWSQLAIVCELAGKTTAAENWYRKAIEGGRKHETPSALFKSLYNFSRFLARQTERLGEAKELAEEALSIGRTLDPATGQIWSIYTVLARIADRDQPKEACEYRRRAREAKRSFAGTRFELRRYAGLLIAMVAACSGQEEALPTIAAHQKAMRTDKGEWSGCADAIDQLLAGERDADVLCAALHYDGAMIIETILRALEDPSTLDALLSDSDPA